MQKFADINVCGKQFELIALTVKVENYERI